MITFGKMSNKDIFKRIDKGIDIGAETGSLLLATQLKYKIISTETNKIQVYRKKTAHRVHTRKYNLVSATKVMRASNLYGYHRYDVIIDEDKIPYFMWEEYGSEAPRSLPYSRDGSRNFRKSLFKGHKMVRTAVSNVKRDKQLIAYTVGGAIRAAVYNQFKSNETENLW